MYTYAYKYSYERFLQRLYTHNMNRARIHIHLQICTIPVYMGTSSNGCAPKIARHVYIYVYEKHTYIYMGASSSTLLTPDPSPVTDHSLPNLPAITHARTQSHTQTHTHTHTHTTHRQHPCAHIYTRQPLNCLDRDFEKSYTNTHTHTHTQTHIQIIANTHTHTCTHTTHLYTFSTAWLVTSEIHAPTISASVPTYCPS